MKIPQDEKILIGWKEWCGLPELSLPAVKAKIDTGAKTSCLHAISIKPFYKHGEPWVSFTVDPIQAEPSITLDCTARIIDQRYITSSNGHKENRYVINTPICLGDFCWNIDLTLSNRENMRFRMLLGRDAIKNHTLIDPVKMHCLGKITKRKAKKLYR